jgi:hypothetical protein
LVEVSKLALYDGYQTGLERILVRDQPHAIIEEKLAVGPAPKRGHIICGNDRLNIVLEKVIDGPVDVKCSPR